MSRLAQIRTWLRSRKACAALRAPFEPVWSRWAVTLALAAALPVGILYPEALTPAIGAVVALLTLHFLLILLRKLNFGLLELFAAALLGGTVNALLLSMPGMLASVWVSAALTLTVAAWVLYGVVKGLVCAQILGADSATNRLGWITAAWLTSLAPALAIAAGFLFAFADNKALITPTFHACAYPFATLALAGLALRFALERKVRREAQKLVAEN